MFPGVGFPLSPTFDRCLRLKANYVLDVCLREWQFALEPLHGTFMYRTAMMLFSTNSRDAPFLK